MSAIEQELLALRLEVERMKSREAILQQLTRYGRGQEWQDVSLMNDVFFEDAEIDFGFFKGTWREYRPVLMDIERGAEATFHLCAAPQIEFDRDDRAYVECYGLTGGRRGDTTQLFGGRYFHTFERRNNVWKSARCFYVLDWTVKQTEKSPPPEQLSGINAVRDRSPNNPLFRRMGIAETA